MTTTDWIGVTVIVGMWSFLAGATTWNRVMRRDMHTLLRIARQATADKAFANEALQAALIAREVVDGTTSPEQFNEAISRLITHGRI